MKVTITKEAKRKSRVNVLNRRLKKQQRSAKMVKKRITKIEKELWEIELERFDDSGLLQQLTWEYTDWVRLLGATAIGIRSKENDDNEIVKEIKKWYWKHEDGFGFVKLYKKVVDKYEILFGLDLHYADDNEDKNVVRVWAIDNEETGTGVPSEKIALKQFVKKWNLKVDW